MLELTLSVFLFATLFLVFMWYRNDWIYRQCIKLLEDDDPKAFMTWSYNKMWWHFWIWDINKMINEDNK